MGMGVAMKLSTATSSCASFAFAILLSAAAFAGVSVAPNVSVGVVVTPDGSGFDWDYTVTLNNAAAGAVHIGAIEIPEVKAGYLTSPGGLPSGWSAQELTSPAFGDPLLKPDGTPGAWLLLSTTDFASYIGTPGNNPLTFDLFSDFGFQTPADVSTATPSGGVYYVVTTIDPSTPGSAPEPATWVLMGLGALGLVALRRRKNRLAPAFG